MRDKERSPELVTLWAAFLIASDGAVRGSGSTITSVWQGQLLHTHTLRAVSPTLLLPGPVSLCFLDEVQGSLFQVLLLVRDGASSPECHIQ